MNENTEQTENEQDDAKRAALSHLQAHEHAENSELATTTSAEQPEKSGTDGYYNVKMDTLYGFYPQGTQIQYRALNAVELRNWAGVDFQNPLELYQATIDILKKCILGIAVNEIREIDRFRLIMFIHELTMVEPESKVQLSYQCAAMSCANKWNKSLSSDSFIVTEYNKEFFDKYKDEVSGTVIVKHKTLGDIVYKDATIGAISEARRWAVSKGEQFVKENKRILDVIPHFVSRYTFAEFDNFVNSVYLNSDITKYSVMLDVANKLHKSNNEYVPDACPVCGTEAAAKIRTADFEYLFLRRRDSEYC